MLSNRRTSVHRTVCDKSEVNQSGISSSIGVGVLKRKKAPKVQSLAHQIFNVRRNFRNKCSIAEIVFIAQQFLWQLCNIAKIIASVFRGQSRYLRIKTNLKHGVQIGGTELAKEVQWPEQLTSLSEIRVRILFVIKFKSKQKKIGFKFSLNVISRSSQSKSNWPDHFSLMSFEAHQRVCLSEKLSRQSSWAPFEWVQTGFGQWGHISQTDIQQISFEWDHLVKLEIDEERECVWVQK